MYELIHWLVTMQNSFACARMPAVYDLATSERWYGSFASKKAFRSPLLSDWWTCIPLPFCPSIGLGMNVA